MSRNIDTLGAIAATLAILGLAAAQDRNAREIPGWGETVDPRGDCKFTLNDRGLAITVPGAASSHNLSPLPEYNLDAPRVLQAASGDFQFEVKVLKFPKPEANTAGAKGGASYVAAGPVIWQDERNFLRCFRAANGDRNDLFVHVEAFRNGAKQNVVFQGGGGRPPDTDMTLRVERKGNEFLFSVSLDSRGWIKVGSIRNFDLQPDVRAGVAVVNSTTKEVTASFTEPRVGRAN